MFGLTITREAKSGRCRSQTYPVVPIDPGVRIIGAPNTPTIGNPENFDRRINYARVVARINTENMGNSGITRNSGNGGRRSSGDGRVTTAWDGKNTARFGN